MNIMFEAMDVERDFWKYQECYELFTIWKQYYCVALCDAGDYIANMVFHKETACEINDRTYPGGLIL